MDRADGSFRCNHALRSARLLGSSSSHHKWRSRNLQLIESSVVGLRAACYRLKSETHATEFLLFPMIHIGTAEYYRDVFSRLRECDVVLFEGVSSFRARLLATSYRWVTRRARLGLVSQAKELRLRELPARLVRADVTGGEFEEHWHGVPLRQRIALLCLAPAYGVWLYLTASRESIGKGLGREDLPSRGDMARAERAPEFEHAVVGARDQKLVSCIREVLQRDDAAQTIGIVYGAGHMQSVLQHLMSENDYQVSRSEWMTVMEYESDG